MQIHASKRSERLTRLEDQSKELFKKLSRISEKGNENKKKVDDLHERYASEEREDAVVTSTQPEPTVTLTQCSEDTPSCLSYDEEAYTRRRAERLQRLEGLSKSMFEQLNKNTERADSITSKLDDLHSKYATDNTEKPKTIPQTVACSSIVPEELTESVIITAIPCQVAVPSTSTLSQPLTGSGAVPKTVELLASKRKERQKDKKEGGTKDHEKNENKNEESLEELFLRLSELPCGDTKKDNDEKTDNEEKD